MVCENSPYHWVVYNPPPQKKTKQPGVDFFSLLKLMDDDMFYQPLGWRMIIPWLGYVANNHGDPNVILSAQFLGVWDPFPVPLKMAYEWGFTTVSTYWLGDHLRARPIRSFSRTSTAKSTCSPAAKRLFFVEKNVWGRKTTSLSWLIRKKMIQ